MGVSKSSQFVTNKDYPGWFGNVVTTQGTHLFIQGLMKGVGCLMETKTLFPWGNPKVIVICLANHVVAWSVYLQGVTSKHWCSFQKHLVLYNLVLKKGACHTVVIYIAL